MRVIWITIALFICFSSISSQDRYEPGVVIARIADLDRVTIANGIAVNGSEQLNTVLSNFQLQSSRKLPHADRLTDGWYRLEFPVDKNLEAIKTALLACPDIERANFNYYAHFSGNPNDDRWDDQWSLHLIEMWDAWDVVLPDNEILVGVIDGGLNYTHEDFEYNIWSNPDEIPGNGQDDDGNNYVDDIRGWNFAWGTNAIDYQSSIGDWHGTKVAGVVGARTYNGKGLAGVAGGWQGQSGVKIVGLHTYPQGALGPTKEHVRSAILYLEELRQRGYKVIANMSFQLDQNDTELSDFKDAVASAVNAGVLIVAAAGNVQDDPPYDHPDVVNLPAPAPLGRRACHRSVTIRCHPGR